MMVEPSGVQIDWTGKKFSVACCEKAFSPTHKCKLAFCEDCFGYRMDKFAVGGRVSRHKGTSGKATKAKSTSKVAGKEKCGGHTLSTLSDLEDLEHKTDVGYLKHKRKGSQKNSPNIAITCWDCGDKF